MQEMNLPVEFLERMKKLLGEEYAAFLESYGKERAQGLRINTVKAEKEAFFKLSPFQLSQVEWCDSGFYYHAEERPGRHPYHEAGLYYIQEPSAMAVVELLCPRSGEKILDLCAAPGGKTSHIAAKLQGTGFLLSNEIHPQRVKILSQNVERMGLKNTVVTNESSARLADCFPGYFDRIVVDAPCSGEGMFRKDENAIAEWSPENVALCASRQQEILENADRMLRPGGYMVYSTCTFAMEEDEETIEKFLSSHEEYSMVEREVPECFTRCRIPGAYRLFPHKLEGEGHFVAVLKKGVDGAGSVLPPVKPLKDKKVLADYEDFKRTLGLAVEGDNYLLFGEQLYLVPPEMTDMKGLKVERPGLQLGTFKKNRFEPSHALALSLQADEVNNKVTFAADSREIHAYLHGESIFLEENLHQAQNGWCLVTVDGYSIGWGKVHNGILKNHYPKGLRRM